MDGEGGGSGGGGAIGGEGASGDGGGGEGEEGGEGDGGGGAGAGGEGVGGGSWCSVCSHAIKSEDAWMVGLRSATAVGLCSAMVAGELSAAMVACELSAPIGTIWPAGSWPGLLDPGLASWPSLGAPRI